MRAGDSDNDLGQTVKLSAPVGNGLRPEGAFGRKEPPQPIGDLEEV